MKTFYFFPFPVSFYSISSSYCVCMCDADASAAASAQSHGLFSAYRTVALHNLCLFCSLWSHLLGALTTVCFTYSDPCSPHVSRQLLTDTARTQQQESVRHLLLKEMLRPVEHNIWLIGPVKCNLNPTVTYCFVKMTILGSCGFQSKGYFGVLAVCTAQST